MNAPEALDMVWDYIEKNGLFAYNPLYNVNIPHDPKEIRITKQGGAYFTDTFLHKGGHLYVQSGEVVKDSGNDPLSDINAIRQNAISITPLVTTRTEMSVFKKLNNI
jgi:broad specificity polyphosphatase/5'/3'-nucleotidase SurE